MGLILDALKEVPLSAVLQERVALAEQKYDEAVEESEELRQRVADLERENAELRAQLPSEPAGDLNADTIRVLVYLFGRDNGLHARAVAQRLQMDSGVAQYHLEELGTLGLARRTGGNYVQGVTYWGLTPDGRSYVVKNDLIPK